VSQENVELFRLRWITVMWFEDGRASRTVGYNTRREALEAVGLQE